MAISLPPEIKELMTVTVTWEKFQGFDEYAQPKAYGPAVELRCWIEPHLSTTASGETVTRTRDGTVVDPDFDLYFDGDDTQAQQIRLWDRFTVGGVGSEGRQLQALAVSPMYGPPFDNRNPWLIVVAL
jgi:hypothetical protein